MCTSNLHHLLCVLTRQAEVRGDSRHCFELFVERGIAELKRKTKFRSTSQPEVVIANNIELGNKLRSLQQERECIPLADVVGGKSHSVSEMYDRPDPESGSSLVGRGVQLEGGNADTVLHKVRSEPEVWSDRWGEELVEGMSSQNVRVYKHARASLMGQQVFASQSYTHAKMRDSSHVMVGYENDENVEHHIGQVQYYVRVRA